jgi:hypothetical protein
VCIGPAVGDRRYLLVEVQSRNLQSDVNIRRMRPPTTGPTTRIDRTLIHRQSDGRQARCRADARNSGEESANRLGALAGRDHDVDDLIALVDGSWAYRRTPSTLAFVSSRNHRSPAGAGE